MSNLSSVFFFYSFLYRDEARNDIWTNRRDNVIFTNELEQERKLRLQLEGVESVTFGWDDVFPSFFFCSSPAASRLSLVRSLLDQAFLI